MALNAPPRPRSSTLTRAKRCLAMGCTQDMELEAKYYRRYSVCKLHMKAPQLLIGGRLQRFCQQCTTFHPLSDFNGVQRSCRRTLALQRQRRGGPGHLPRRWRGQRALGTDGTAATPNTVLDEAAAGDADSSAAALVAPNNGTGQQVVAQRHPAGPNAAVRTLAMLQPASAAFMLQGSAVAATADSSASHALSNQQVPNGRPKTGWEPSSQHTDIGSSAEDVHDGHFVDAILQLQGGTTGLGGSVWWPKRTITTAAEGQAGQGIIRQAALQVVVDDPTQVLPHPTPSPATPSGTADAMQAISLFMMPPSQQQQHVSSINPMAADNNGTPPLSSPSFVNIHEHVPLACTSPVAQVRQDLWPWMTPATSAPSSHIRSPISSEIMRSSSSSVPMTHGYVESYSRVSPQPASDLLTPHYRQSFPQGPCLTTHGLKSGCYFLTRSSTPSNGAASRSSQHQQVFAT